MISEAYRELNAQLHAKDPGYGAKGGLKHHEAVRELMLKYQCQTVLDYGCGKASLRKKLGESVQCYDPAIPKFAGDPVPADVVACTDVLEHIEPDHLDAVIQHLHRLTRKVGLFVIACRPASKQLADGRNAHLIVQNEDWWREKLSPLFHFIADERPQRDELYIVVEPK